MMFKAGFNGYSVKFSPYHEGRLAVATAQNFGIIGNGRWAPPPAPPPPPSPSLLRPARLLFRGPLDTGLQQDSLGCGWGAGRQSGGAGRPVRARSRPTRAVPQPPLPPVPARPPPAPPPTVERGGGTAP